MNDFRPWVLSDPIHHLFHPSFIFLLINYSFLYLLHPFLLITFEHQKLVGSEVISPQFVVKHQQLKSEEHGSEVKNERKQDIAHKDP